MSEATARADAFVAAHLDEATALGERLADLIEEPEAFLEALRRGPGRLADPAYIEMADASQPGTPAPLCRPWPAREPPCSGR